MDVNSFMEQSLANQAKQNSLLEAILDVLKDMNDNGVIIANIEGEPVQVAVINGAISNVTNVVIPEGADAEVVGNVAKVTGKGTTSQATAEKAAVQETKKAAETPVQETVVETPKEDKKKVTIDDARGALKKYAAIEGNDAAMELLSSLGAASVSALAEQGGDALQKLIDKCAGKAD